MENFETIDLNADQNGIAYLTLDREDKRNALSALMLTELAAAAKKIDQSDDIRVVILTGAGETFCAGADLAWMREQMAADVDTRAREATRLAETLFALNTLSKPLIGALQGNAFGGGVGLASVCDVVFGASHIKMALTEVKLGIIPATIGPYVYARIGEAECRRLFLSGRTFESDEALNCGLLSRVTHSSELWEEVEDEAYSFLSCAPGAVAAAKKLARSFGVSIDQDTIAMTIAALKERWETEEAAEGISAFFEKRPPYWKLK
ncbi:MAG: crotonase/enoyl-CoA hydratase family protein [Aestuariivita sp.]|nr:crotonase/enoyl-CoA hydratase family protein [Aestuariivita sp.]MCY4346128.1 crotonase/enoyl-CoA hydratase family protein [Aestuariivita sp.]